MVDFVNLHVNNFVNLVFLSISESDEDDDEDDE